MIVALGHYIKGDNYQVKKKDVKDLIFQITRESNNKKVSTQINCIKRQGSRCTKSTSSPDRLLIDIQAAAVLQLSKEGIKEYQININRTCTYSNPQLFNSYRRDNTNLRQWSCIYS